MRTTGARRAAACTVATIVPSGADWIQYQTVFSIRPQRETCGSRRSTVASAVVPWTVAGKVGRTRASSRLSLGGGAAAAGAARMRAANAAATIFIGEVLLWLTPLSGSALSAAPRAGARDASAVRSPRV